MKKVYLIILFLTILLKPLAQNIKLTTKMPDKAIAGERFRVIYELNAQTKNEKITSSPVEDFQTLLGPSRQTSMQTSSNNGVTTTTHTTGFAYVFIVDKPGTYPLPQITIVVDDKSYTSEKKTIEILPANKQSGDSARKANSTSSSGSATQEKSGHTFAQTILSKKSVYENEGILATIKIYSSHEIWNFNNWFSPRSTDL